MNFNILNKSNKTMEKKTMDKKTTVAVVIKRNIPICKKTLRYILNFNHKGEYYLLCKDCKLIFQKGCYLGMKREKKQWNESKIMV